MKKLIFALALAVLVLLQTQSASALGTGMLINGIYGPPVYYDTIHGGYFAPVVPGAPKIDSTVRQGGAFPSASYYMVGLREGVVTHPRLTFAKRQEIASQYYPKASFSGRFGERSIRVGGYFGSGSARISNGVAGGYVFNG